jgi:hypothetical protein
LVISIALGILAVVLGACLGLCCRRLVQTGAGARDALPPLPALRGPDREELFRRRSAHLRAITLLREWLSAAQREQYARSQHFDVFVSASGRRYRIYHGTQFNIEELDGEGDAVAALCFVPEGRLAVGDVMLAQKIALETNEMAALVVANRIGPLAK